MTLSFVFSIVRRASVLGLLAVGLLLATGCSGDSVSEPDEYEPPELTTAATHPGEVLDAVQAVLPDVVHVFESTLPESHVVVGATLRAGTSYCVDHDCLERCRQNPWCDPRVIHHTNDLWGQTAIDVETERIRVARVDALPGAVVEAATNPEAFTLQADDDGRIHLVNSAFAAHTQDVVATLKASIGEWMPALHDAVFEAQDPDGDPANPFGAVDPDGEPAHTLEATDPDGDPAIVGVVDPDGEPVLVGATLVLGGPRTITGHGGSVGLFPEWDPDNPCFQPNPPPHCYLMNQTEVLLHGNGAATGVATFYFAFEGTLDAGVSDAVRAGENIAFEAGDGGFSTGLIRWWAPDVFTP